MYSFLLHGRTLAYYYYRRYIEHVLYSNKNNNNNNIYNGSRATDRRLELHHLCVERSRHRLKTRYGILISVYNIKYYYIMMEYIGLFMVFVSIPQWCTFLFFTNKIFWKILSLLYV